jgi:hypothetical protein
MERGPTELMERGCEFMTNFESVLEFSHTHCVAICAVLVPLNLLATIGTLGLVGFGRSRHLIRWTVAMALLVAWVMVLHVLTWFVIGVVRVPTYVLLTLGSVCFSINLWAIAHGRSLQRVLRAIGQMVAAEWPWVRTRVVSLPSTGEAKP